MTSVDSDAKTVIFMSVDIADSTTFKEKGHSLDDDPLWLEAFETFFKEVFDISRFDMILPISASESEALEGF